RWSSDPIDRIQGRPIDSAALLVKADYSGGTGNPGYRQGMFYRVTAPALDPTRFIARHTSSGSILYKYEYRTIHDI
ncbi:MAG: hypothetical protein O7G83_06260, partial [Proteobacteria bacterium]|nr:hypothetical protein [Pseudomonadota bacterium]